jgi:hypothetical protein
VTAQTCHAVAPSPIQSSSVPPPVKLDRQSGTRNYQFTLMLAAEFFARNGSCISFHSVLSFAGVSASCCHGSFGRSLNRRRNEGRPCDNFCCFCSDFVLGLVWADQTSFSAAFSCCNRCRSQDCNARRNKAGKNDKNGGFRCQLLLGTSGVDLSWRKRSRYRWLQRYRSCCGAKASEGYEKEEKMLKSLICKKSPKSLA